MKFCVDTYYIPLYFDASDRVTPTFPRNSWSIKGRSVTHYAALISIVPS